MPSSKFEFTDPQTVGSETNLTMASGGNNKNGGCYVSSAVGFVLTLLAILIAVGVGLVVHLAGNKDVVCNCGSVGSGSTAEQVRQECQRIAAQGDMEICRQCPTPSNTPISLATTTSVAPTTAPDKAKVTDVRLPDSVTPLNYDIRLQPYMYGIKPEDFTFKGHIKILVRCDKPTTNVTLHINVLTVNESTIVFKGAQSDPADPKHVETVYDKDRQFIIFKLDNEMQVGKQYTLEMAYTSPLKDDLHGLYYSTYTRNGQKVYIVATQMQPTDARKSFPCMDEPAIKATFDITLVRPDYLISISNMPIVDSSETWQENGITWVADRYQETPKMSTYLLAFIICDFIFKSDTTKYNVTYRAYANHESIDQVDYSLKTGVKIIEHFEDYFEVPYPLPKQDMIAIPDFAAGAMENWGLITYRETAMLFKDGVSNERNRERVAYVVSHELAHMWFGDLVTPSWWGDLWLNEGFASFVEYLGVDYVHPEWNTFEKFARGEIQGAFRFDGLISSHPLYVPVGHPDEINEIFDTISYSKGASVIRMMRHFLGLETFRRGLTRYLKEKQYGAAFHDELWSALTTQAQVDNKKLPGDVKSIMDTWTLQMNYPVVTVTRDFNDQDLLHVSQERYLVDKDAEDPGKYTSSYNYQWTIPLTFTSSKSPMFNQTHENVHWMTKDETTNTYNIGQNNLPSPLDTNGWVLANVEQNGYYRVNYHTGNWEALGRQLVTDHSVIGTINRAQIINDAWNLAKSGDLGLDIALKTIEYLDKERAYVPWSAAVEELRYVNTMLSLTPLRRAFQTFMKAKLSPAYNYYGLNNTGASHKESYARSTIANQACSYGIQACLDAASGQFATWMGSPENNMIDPNVKSTVYCFAVHDGGWEEFQFALNRYKNETVATEKFNLLAAMSCASKPWILNYYLNIILEEDSPIRKQDALYVINYVSSGGVIGRYLAWNFFRANYDTLKKRFGPSFFSWTRTIREVTSAFNTQFELDEIMKLEKSKAGQLASGVRAFQQAKEKAASNIKWMEKNIPVLEAYFQDNGYL